MLIIADFVSPLVRSSLLRASVFIEQAGTLSWCIVPDDRDCAKARFVARYEERPFENRKYSTRMQMPVADGHAVLRTGLRDAEYLLAFLADRPAWMDHLVGADPHADDEAIVRSLGIEPDATCRASVAAWAQGEFLAPDAGGYAYFLVDTYGEVSVISRSDTVLPVAFHLAADRAAGTDIVSRLAKIPVPAA